MEEVIEAENRKLSIIRSVHFYSRKQFEQGKTKSYIELRVPMRVGEWIASRAIKTER